MPLTQTQQQMRQLESQVEQVITDAWQRAKAFIQGLLSKFLKAMKGNPFTWLYEQSKLPILKQQVTQAVDAYTAFVGTVVAHAKQEAAKIGRQEAASLGSQAAASLGQAVTQLQGIGRLVADKICSVLMLAVDGLHPAVDASLARLLDEPHWRALRLAVTETWNAYRGALLASFAVAGAMGWEWVAHAGACAFCQGMDGTQHPMSEEFVSHPNCRCDALPLAL